MRRINLHYSASRAGFTRPKWFDILLNQLIEKFRQEYQIPKDDAHSYFLGTDDMSRIAKLFVDEGITCEGYKMEGIPSYGLLIDISHPMIVEAKLKVE